MTIGQDTPFNLNAVAYHMRGWHPFPLWDTDALPGKRAMGKKSPPKGYTGRGGTNATREQVEQWRDTGRCYNLGSRMPTNVVAIDVDAYHGGDVTLAKLEAELGKLPRTYTVTARTDGSGHRYYTVPGKRVWKNPGEGIEILHWGWRYAVMPPSIHPDTGTPYLWYGPDGKELVNQLGPKPEAFVPLPRKWIEYLDTKKDPTIVESRATLESAEVNALLSQWATDDEACPHMLATLHEVKNSTTGGRHDACMRAQMKLLRYSEAGHPGGRTAFLDLRGWFFAALSGERDPSSEWRRGIVNAAERIAASPTPDHLQGCHVPLVTTMDEVTIPVQQSRTTRVRPSQVIEMTSRTVEMRVK